VTVRWCGQAQQAAVGSDASCGRSRPASSASPATYGGPAAAAKRRDTALFLRLAQQVGAVLGSQGGHHGVVHHGELLRGLQVKVLTR
jgi:hypothetical protein